MVYDRELLENTIWRPADGGQRAEQPKHDHGRNPTTPRADQRPPGIPRGDITLGHPNTPPTEWTQ